MRMLQHRYILRCVSRLRLRVTDSRSESSRTHALQPPPEAVVRTADPPHISASERTYRNLQVAESTACSAMRLCGVSEPHPTTTMSEAFLPVLQDSRAPPSSAGDSVSHAASFGQCVAVCYDELSGSYSAAHTKFEVQLAELAADMSRLTARDQQRAVDMARLTATDQQRTVDMARLAATIALLAEPNFALISGEIAAELTKLLRLRIPGCDVHAELRKLGIIVDHVQQLITFRGGKAHPYIGQVPALELARYLKSCDSDPRTFSQRLFILAALMAERRHRLEYIGENLPPPWHGQVQVPAGSPLLNAAKQLSEAESAEVVRRIGVMHGASVSCTKSSLRSELVRLVASALPWQGRAN